MIPSSQTAHPKRRVRLRHRVLRGLHRQVGRLTAPKEADEGEWSESVYRRIYWEAWERNLAASGLSDSKLDILEAGCGTGRMAVELARQGHEVHGIDVHHASIEGARAHADRSNVRLKLTKGDLATELARIPIASLDAAVCLEVLYTCPEYEDLLRAFVAVLKPGGFLFVSFRTPVYFIGALVAQRQFEQAAFVAENREGVLKIATLPTYYNWQTPVQAMELLDELGLEKRELRPVGVFSGVGVDGGARLLDLQRIERMKDRSAIEKLEAANLDGTIGAARYMLAVAHVPAGRRRGGAPTAA